MPQTQGTSQPADPRLALVALVASILVALLAGCRAEPEASALAAVPEPVTRPAVTIREPTLADAAVATFARVLLVRGVCLPGDSRRQQRHQRVHRRA